MNSEYILGYTADFKTKIVIEVLREKISIVKLAKKYNIEPFLIRKWKLQFIDIVDESLRKKDSEIELLKQKLMDINSKIKNI
jgi:putative transposase